MIELAVDNININSFFTRWAHPNQHLHERAGCGQHQHQQLFHQEVPPPVQLLLERFLAIEANMAAPPIMVRG